MRYLQARTNLLKLYSAITTQNIQDAQPLLASQTVDWITRNGEIPLREALKPLDSNQETNTNTEDSPRINPVDDLLAQSLSNITDSVPGIEQNEDSNRVELFAKQKDGSFQRIVMIKENNEWKLLRIEKEKTITP